jgi:peptidoglycan hydrolase-like protein with peptidoglycan-binding domain
VRSAAHSSRGETAARWSLLQSLGWSHRDAIAFAVGVSATVAILANVLFLQSGQHPAPMFRSSLTTAAPVTAKDTGAVAALPRARPAEPAPSAAAGKAEPAPTARPAGEVIADIQRELGRRGFYDGAVDGRYGPRTDAAVRDFEQVAGLKPSTEPGEALLTAIKRSNAKFARSATGTTGAPGAPARPPAQPVRHDPIAEVIAPSPSKRVLAVQRALAEFGYGQIKPNGILGPETQAAIEKFERERKLPVTGQVSERVTRELAAITGRPLE